MTKGRPNMIRKTIHYCWFGGGQKPQLAEKCFESWKKHCPNYEIIEWNESNFDLDACPEYVKQAYNEKLYAFVSDYARLKIIYDNGGVYLDTDVELIKSLDRLLEYDAFFGFEDKSRISTGIGFGAISEHPFLLELMEDYYHMSFYKSDGTINYITCPDVNTHVFLKHGLKQNDKKQILDGNILILPTIYLCPINYGTDIRRYSLKTISIHWFSKSWMTEESIKEHIERRKELVKDFWIHLPNRIIKKIIGEENYKKIRNKLQNE